MASVVERSRKQVSTYNDPHTTCLQSQNSPVWLRWLYLQEVNLEMRGNIW
jgi:hypothetical protein